MTRLLDVAVLYLSPWWVEFWFVTYPEAMLAAVAP